VGAPHSADTDMIVICQINAYLPDCPQCHTSHPENSYGNYFLLFYEFAFAIHESC
jgi:hypothetical protein